MLPSSNFKISFRTQKDAQKTSLLHRRIDFSSFHLFHILVAPLLDDLGCSTDRQIGPFHSPNIHPHSRNKSNRIIFELIQFLPPFSFSRTILRLISRDLLNPHWIIIHDSSHHDNSLPSYHLTGHALPTAFQLRRA